MQIHVVKPGDTLWGISQRYGSDINSMISLNEIGNPNVLVVGQALVIPDEIGRASCRERV